MLNTATLPLLLKQLGLQSIYANWEEVAREVETANWSYSHYLEFKFSKTSAIVKDKFFDEICRYKFEVMALVINKSKIYSTELRNDNDSFYNYFVKLLMQYDNNPLQNASIKIDGSGDKKFKNALTAYLRRDVGEHKIKKFSFIDSRKDNLIQLADMVIVAIANFPNLCQEQKMNKMNRVPQLRHSFRLRAA